MRHEVVSSGRRNRMFDHGLLSLSYPIFYKLICLIFYSTNCCYLVIFPTYLTYERPSETSVLVLYFSDGCQVLSLVVSLSLESL